MESIPKMFSAAIILVLDYLWNQLDAIVACALSINGLPEPIKTYATIMI